MFTIFTPLLFLVGCVGYFMNLFKLIRHHDISEPKDLLRIVGVFVPFLGAIMGFL